METTTPEIAQYQTDHDLLVVLNERVAALTEAVKAKNNDHEERIRTLERHRWTVGGAASAVGILGGYVLQFFT